MTKFASRIAGFARASFGSRARLGFAAALTILVPLLLWGQSTAWQFSGSVASVTGVNIGIGTTNPQTPLHVVNSGANDYSLEPTETLESNGFTLLYTNAYTSTNYVGPIWRSQRARGTSVAPTVVSSADSLSRWSGTGYDGSSFQEAALIRMSVGSRTSGMPGQIDFWTTPDTGNSVVQRMIIDQNGNVGIGIANPQNTLSVNGNIQAKQVLVTATPADYVFDPKYRLQPLSEVSSYVKANRHLPDIPSAKEVEAKGISLGDMQSKLLAKVEELTLHMIEEHDRNDRLERQNRDLQERLARLEAGQRGATGGDVGSR